MKPIDLRNATWAECSAHVTDDMVRVHIAHLRYGPGTTRQISERSGISLLTLRPRSTDLYKLGLLELIGRSGNEGIYAHRTDAQAIASSAWRTRADFRRGSDAGEPRVVGGFPSVEAAINSLPLADRAALGARLMAKYGMLLKRHEAGRPDQLTLLPST